MRSYLQSYTLEAVRPSTVLRHLPVRRRSVGHILGASSGCIRGTHPEDASGRGASGAHPMGESYCHHKHFAISALALDLLPASAHNARAHSVAALVHPLPCMGAAIFPACMHPVNRTCPPTCMYGCAVLSASPRARALAVKSPDLFGG